MGFRKTKALDNLQKLEQLTALENLGRRSLPDSTAEIPGTGPEKLVYNYLKRLGIRFQFQYHQEDYEDTAKVEELYIPDFILPDYNIKIEVFGEYWHALPRKRESDLRKWARHLFAGNSITEHGIPTFPDSGGYKGKHIIWWAQEIHYYLPFLFSRDLPELFSKDRIKGKPEQYLLDRVEEERKMKARAAGMAVKRMRPKVHPFEREVQRLRKRQVNLDRIYPILGKIKNEIKQRIPRVIKKRKEIY